MSVDSSGDVKAWLCCSTAAVQNACIVVNSSGRSTQLSINFTSRLRERLHAHIKGFIDFDCSISYHINNHRVFHHPKPFYPKLFFQSVGR
jgi:hypothetical protein